MFLSGGYIKNDEPRFFSTRISIIRLPADENGRKRKQLRCALTILAIGRRIISDNSQRTWPACCFASRTLKLNTLAINLAFMRLSRGIEGSDGRDVESVSTLRERAREKAERVKIVYMHLYPSFRGRGMFCSHGDTLTHRTHHWRRKKMVRGRVAEAVREAEDPSKDSLQLDLLFRATGMGDCDPCNDLGNVL